VAASAGATCTQELGIVRNYVSALLGIVLGLCVHADAAQRRCGWLFNPSPANWWLTDRDGEWTLSEQGGPQAEGLDQLTKMKRPDWVSTNVGSYGYGCACLELVLQAEEKRVSRLLSAEALPLARCRSDPALPSEPR